MVLHRTLHQRSRPVALATAAVFGVATITATARDARAESPNVSPDGKGIVGGGLLGAEVVTITEALAGVRQGWAYGLGAVLGAAGGATGGFFVEQASSDGRAPVYMLVGGLALVIPAIVLSLNATRYVPEEGATEDRAPIGPVPEPGAPGGSIVAPPPPTPAPTAPPVAPTPPPPSSAPSTPPQSLLDVHEGSLRVGVPVPDVRPVFSVAEQRLFGTRSTPNELHMAMLHVAF
ncbi:MAG TPA: hypothetical protein VEK07_20225 [Polyangiaceae bacterium]|nr:hypothetical protein [Polyangiaceae bacterium]